MKLDYCIRTTIKKHVGFIINPYHKTTYYIEYMSIWNRFIGLRNAEDSISNKKISVQYNALRYAIVDVEIGLKIIKSMILGHSVMMVQHFINLRKKSCSNFLVIQTISADIISSIMMQSICLPIKHSTASLSIHFMYHLYYFRNALIISL